MFVIATTQTFAVGIGGAVAVAWAISKWRQRRIVRKREEMKNYHGGGMTNG